MTEGQTVEAHEPVPPFQCSRSIAQIATALAKAQGELENPTRDRTAKITGDKPYQYKYADLASVLDAIRPVLSKHGIAIVQPPVMVSQNRLEVVTTLIHKSGEWIASSLGIDLTDKRPQSVGVAITYLRRYQAQAIAGVASEEDDDAQGSDVQVSGRGRRDERPASRPEAPPVPAAVKAPADDVYLCTRLVYLGYADKEQKDPNLFGIYTAQLGADVWLETADKAIARACLDAKKAKAPIVIQWATAKDGRRVIDNVAKPAAVEGAAA